MTATLPTCDQSEQADLLALTAEIVSAYVSRNSQSPSALPELIAGVHGALAKLGSGEPEAEPQRPAVSIRRSVTADHLICLEDGLPFRSLKRHLRTEHGMMPDQYREKWGLPWDYPMVAPDYSARRSELARSIGLGRKPAPKRSRGRRS